MTTKLRSIAIALMLVSVCTIGAIVASFRAEAVVVPKIYPGTAYSFTDCNGGNGEATWDLTKAISYATAKWTPAQKYAEVGAWALYEGDAEAQSEIWKTVEAGASGTFDLHAAGTSSWYLSAISIGLAIASADAHFYFEVIDNYDGGLETWSFCNDREALWNEVDNNHATWETYLSFHGDQGHQYTLQARVQIWASVLSSPLGGGGTAVADCAGPALNIAHNYAGNQGITLSYVSFIGSAGCVAEGTPVRMASGSVRSIENIKPGDKVLGFDPVTGSYASETVKKTMRSTVNAVLSINGGSLRTTLFDQPIYAKNSSGVASWVRDPISIQVGWSILAPTSGTWVEVQSLDIEFEKTKVYDIVTDGYQTYIGGSYLLMDKGKK
jgi:hypothetical protein